MELAEAIKVWLGGQCLREYTEVYINGGRADILHDISALQKKRNIIELKCQSAFQDDLDLEGFARAYSQDRQPASRIPKSYNYRHLVCYWYRTKYGRSYRQGNCRVWQR